MRDSAHFDVSYRLTEPAILGVFIATSAFCARCRSIWSMRTRAIMALSRNIGLNTSLNFRPDCAFGHS